MGYCTVQDLESYFLNKNFKCEDYLSNGKAAEFIRSDTALMDAYLRVRYPLPVTNKDDLVLLKVINEKMVVGTIDDIFREKSEDGKFNRGRDTRKEALAYLKDIQNGDLVLNTGQRTSAIKFNNVDSEGNCVEKRFKDANIEPNASTPRLLPGNGQDHS